MDRRAVPADPPLPSPEDAEGAGDAEEVVTGVRPLDVDGTRTVLVGTLLWAAAFCVLLPFWDRLEAQGRLWWLWTCLVGVGLGVLGWEHCRRRARRRLVRAATRD